MHGQQNIKKKIIIIFVYYSYSRTPLHFI